MIKNFLRSIGSAWKSFMGDTKAKEVADELYNKLMTLESDADKSKVFDMLRGRFQTYLELEKAEKTSHLLLLLQELDRTKNPVVIRPEMLKEVKEQTGRALEEIKSTSKEEETKLLLT